jgi:hypothetical protein
MGIEIAEFICREAMSYEKQRGFESTLLTIEILDLLRGNIVPSRGRERANRVRVEDMFSTFIFWRLARCLILPHPTLSLQRERALCSWFFHAGSVPVRSSPRFGARSSGFENSPGV